MQVALVTGVLVVIAAISVLLQQPLLAPSLASAVFVQVMSPTEASARPWNTAVGQIVGVFAGLLAVHLAFATTTPTFMGDHSLAWLRVLAVAIAVMLTVAGEIALGAISPAGGATAVVFAIGAETANLAGVGRMLAAILLVTVLGELARRIILRRG